MASVISLGLHQPTGLQHAIHERFVPPDSPATSYEWSCYSSGDESGYSEDDELLVTSRSVIWSRGGLFRKCYNFDLEKEDVTQAVLTTFPSVGPLAAKDNKTSQRKGIAANRESAIVVFLKTQAHVYFLAGTSHVIHLPFEVESASAAPNGLIIQRKLRIKNFVTASLKFPRVPPNSFVSSQPHPWSAASSTFSTASLGAPRQLQIPSAMDQLWDPPALKDDTNWPRLFSISDPLSEMGLVVTNESGRNRDRGPKKLSALNVAEEILYVSRRDDFSPKGSENPLVLALTLNRETSMYTVWKFAYVGEETKEADKHRVASGTTSRRRSSFQPGTATGATTPTGNVHQTTYRESFGGNKPLPGMKNRKEESRDKTVDFVASLDPDFESSTAIPRRKSRRVSSMLARADLSASHDHSAYTGLAIGHSHNSRRGDSLSSQHTRLSVGGLAPNVSQATLLNGSTNGFLDAPVVDDLLEELRAGGDFEGFHSMGLEDDEFDALKQEVILTKIKELPAEYDNLRYSRQQKPAASQCKIFTIAAPPSAAEVDQQNTIVVCILDPDEGKLLVITLHFKTHESATGDKIVNVVTYSSSTRASGVIDACRLDDGRVSRILVLTQSPDGYGELSLQAPWSSLMKVVLPEKFAMSNTRSLSHDLRPSTKREGGFKRVLSQGPRVLRGLRNSTTDGLVDLVDEEGKMHQLQFVLQPRNPHVAKIIEACRAILPGSRGGEGILVCWWHVMQWMRLESIDTGDIEWTALVITLFSMVLGLSSAARPVRSKSHRKRKPRTSLLRSSSGAQSDENWDLMMADETSRGSPLPSWAENGGWKWLAESGDVGLVTVALESPLSLFSSSDSDEHSSLRKHVKFARDFATTQYGSDSIASTLPTAGHRESNLRRMALADIFIGLHLLHEEQKLDTTVADSFSNGVVSLAPVLSQIARWLGWESWIRHYESEDALLLVVDYDTDSPIASRDRIPQTLDCPVIYDWIQTCFRIRNLASFPTLPELFGPRFYLSPKIIPNLEQWKRLTPRTLLFVQLFSVMRADWTAAEFVEALATAGADLVLLETLPEAILAPLQEALVHCQTEPPVSWNRSLLALVGREDVSVLLTPGQRPRQTQPTILTPSHEATLDIHTACLAIADPESKELNDPYSSTEADRQTITRWIFKTDRRMNEAMNILSTSKTTIARIKPQAHWTESEMLEAQKEHVQILAVRTLAIPSGRGLLYFGGRTPLLTQKWSIGGFVLTCLMKPDNNAVGVDKSSFTEEKVCWAFFHAGVSAGLSISHDAKGIDTSWILYNKPVPDLNMRHAGFLLGLGLNGHLKSVAKWVAFKYLTPKHTMTSIGLLLGLAASYIGTMDSLITRLLSVHVTRMLPPGAAELNLSPLTQTTGIMGIGLLYWNTQHRRMSEIMVSEIEHIDTETEEEPLRNEGYRLAAGFALGFINLGNGTDLKGLHDMRLTERLLVLAVGSKKVNQVHIFDKATAGAVIAIALIFMKSENHILAKKVDIPDSLLQFDYVRPDIFLLRTVARHLIMWSQIEPSFEWVHENLPEAYRGRSMLTSVTELTTMDLPFYDIIGGLCFAIALRFAGSASITVRDLLLHYLDQLMRICKIEVDSFDMKLTRNTVRTCQDLLALSCSIVMAGTGDLAVFRRLRSMHGRDDNETPYGSHLAAHLAIGALFLGGGTFTFGTSNLAVAALLVAFYPIFPSSIQDNKSHLQAFRHFWVMAAEARCLVAKDIDTNQPVPIPITVALRNGEQSLRHTPCLLPELDHIKTVRTNSPEYWNLVLDFESNKAHVAAFKATRTIYVRRRPAHEANTSPFQATLQALDKVASTSSQSLEWLFELPAFAGLTKAEKALVLPPDHGGSSTIHAGTSETVIDARLVLENASLNSGKKDRLLGLKLLFEWADQAKNEGRDMQWIRGEVVDRLKSRMWVMAEGGE